MGSIAIEEMTIELRFVPGEEAETLDLKLTGRREGKPSVSFDFTLARAAD